MNRPPAVAGRFYPDDEGALRQQVRALLGEPLGDASVVACISPHAGYMYSGAVAGDVFRRLRVPPVTVVLGPNHTGRGARAAIMSHGRFTLPGGAMPIDSAVAEELRAVALLTEDSVAHQTEHSLEVQLPFLLHRNPKTRLVPVCLGRLPFESCMRIGSALADIVIRHGRDVLLVASTDMSHYLPAEEAARLDGMALEPIQALDAEALYRTVFDNDISMCGVIPTTVVLAAAKALGATEAVVHRYTHSGTVSGDHSRVVGYAGVTIR
ncbi:MAG: AmmeMemoRadiSam system protein B [Myxococcota bacterium]